MPDDPIKALLRQEAARAMKAIYAARGQQLTVESTPEYLAAGAGDLQKTLGQKLAAYIVGCGTPAKVGHWARGTETPNLYEANTLRTAIEINEILVTRLKPKEMKLWWTSPNYYIDPTMTTLPMDEIMMSPDVVRRAALSLLL